MFGGYSLVMKSKKLNIVMVELIGSRIAIAVANDSKEYIYFEITNDLYFFIFCMKFLKCTFKI